MADKIEVVPTAMADRTDARQKLEPVIGVTELSTPGSPSSVVTTNPMEKVTSHPTRPSLSASPRSSRSSMSGFFRMSRNLSRVVAPDAFDDDDDYSMSDDDDDDDDSDPEDMRDGDELMNEQSSNQTASGQQSNNSPSGDAFAAGAGGANGLRPRFVPGNDRSVDQTTREVGSTSPANRNRASSAAVKSTATGSPAPTTKAARSPSESNATRPLSTATTVRSSIASPSTSESRPLSTASKVQSSDTATEGRKSPPPAKPDPLAPTAAAPYGYKIVTVKKPDGTIAKVKRPLKEGEKAPTVSTKPKSTMSKTSSQSSVPKVTSIGSIDASISPSANEKVAPLTLAKTSEPTTVTVKEVQEPSVPAGKGSKLPEISEKQIDEKGAVKVSTTELQRVTSPRPPSTAEAPPVDDETKGMRRAALAFKIATWAVGILLPLFFLGLAVATAKLNKKPLPAGFDKLIQSTDDTNGSSSSSSSVATFLLGNSNTVSTSIDPLTQAIKIAASAWPIVFAAVIAQTFKMYAALKVERGIKLMQLEQLISSHSVGSALKQPFMLRTFNWTTITLFIIWCLSPLAGQAILRMVSTADTYDPIQVNVTYFSYNTTTQQARDAGTWSYKGGYDTDVPSSWFDSALLTALVQGYSQTKELNEDIYYNLRIPIYDPSASSFVNKDDKSLGASWTTNFSSLLGYPFWINQTFDPLHKSFDAAGNLKPNNTFQETTFTITTSYFDFECSDSSVIAASGSVMQSHGLYLNKNRTMAITAENNTKSIYTQLPWYPPEPPGSDNLLPNETHVVPVPGQSVNTTNLLNPPTNGTSIVSSPTPSASANATIVASSTSVSSTSEASATPTIFANGTTFENVTQTQEKAVQSSTASSVELYYKEPGPNGTLYYSTKKDAQNVYFFTCPYNTVVLETTFYCSGIEANAICYPIAQRRLFDKEPHAMSLGYWFPSVLQNLGDINPTAGQYSMLEQFIVNPQFGATLNLSDTSATHFDAGSVTGAQLSNRLGMVLNTIWALGLNEGAFVGPSWDSFQNKIQTGKVVGNATGKEYTIYQAHWGWLATLVVCSALLTIAAIAAAIWETRVVGPDFLGFANTALRKNVKMPKNISNMDARDRLIALRDTEVILHDTRPDRDIGRIALGFKDEESARLVQGRQYR